jgi:hypothetical protein
MLLLLISLLLTTGDGMAGSGMLLQTDRRLLNIVAEDSPGVVHLVKRPGQYNAPESDDYFVIRDVESYFEHLQNAKGQQLSLRFSDELRVLDVGQRTARLANNVYVVFDCRGNAMVADPSSAGNQPGADTYVDMYRCVMYGSSFGVPFAEKTRMWDVALMMPCAVSLVLKLVTLRP